MTLALILGTGILTTALGWALTVEWAIYWIGR